MKILIVTDGDWSGAGHALMTAINEHTPHRARSVSYRSTPMQYPRDVFAPTGKQLARLVEWCDVLNLHDNASAKIPSNAPYCPVVETYHGTWYRNNHAKWNARARKRGYVRTCLTLDLALYGPKWIGRVMPGLSNLRHPEQGTFRVVHAPSQPARKGTSLVKEALGDVPGVTLDVIRNVSNAECLERKGRAHLLIDQVGPKGLGYGTNALEAWSIGMPVVSSVPDDVREVMEAKLGCLPFVAVSDAADIRRSVERFRDDEIYYNRWRDAGVWYVGYWHDPAKVAEWFVDVCGSTKND